MGSLLRYFEPESWVDYALIPWWMLRFAYAWICTRLLTFWIIKTRPEVLWHGRFMGWGRHDDPSPLIYERCLWAGMRKWAVHTYNSYQSGDSEDDWDTEPVDECPRCGNEI